MAVESTSISNLIGIQKYIIGIVISNKFCNSMTPIIPDGLDSLNRLISELYENKKLAISNVSFFMLHVNFLELSRKRLH